MRTQESGRMRYVWIAVAWIYGLQAFLMFPSLLGEIYRQEQSPWPWEAYVRSTARHGTGDAVFGVYCYAVFYSVPAVLTWISFRRFVKRKPVDGITLSLISLWVACSFGFLLPSCTAFVRELPDAWNGWLTILWLVISGFMCVLLWVIFKEQRRN